MNQCSHSLLLCHFLQPSYTDVDFLTDLDTNMAYIPRKLISIVHRFTMILLASHFNLLLNTGELQMEIEIVNLKEMVQTMQSQINELKYSHTEIMKTIRFNIPNTEAHFNNCGVTNMPSCTSIPAATQAPSTPSGKIIKHNMNLGAYHWLLGAPASSRPTAPVRLTISDDHVIKTLPSSEIDKAHLKSAMEVIKCNNKLCVPAKVSTLAVKLARDAFYGDDVLSKCTVAGEREFFALPVEELKELKTLVFQQCMGLTSTEFEAVWKDCVQAIGQACKRARERKRKNTSEGHV